MLRALYQEVSSQRIVRIAELGRSFEGAGGAVGL